MKKSRTLHHMLFVLSFFIVIQSHAFGALQQSKIMNQKFDLLIVGCGRSGTTYITQLLQESGLDVGHEVLGRTGVVSWFMTADKMHHLSDSQFKPEFKHVFHQVRNPLDVISSWYFNTMQPSSWNLIYKHVPQINPNEPALSKCAKYWYYWNLLAERQAEWRYRIEDIEVVAEEFNRRLNISLNQDSIQSLAKNINARLSITYKVTWLDLLQALSFHDFLSLQCMAWKYGYSIDD